MKLWIAVALTGCIDQTDPVWQLDHDRIVAVRATPPHIEPGKVAHLDALVAHKGAPTDLETPVAAVVYGPKDLSTAISPGSWDVTAPDAATLDAERAELGLDPGAPVPLDVLVQFPDSNGIHLVAKKTVWLGDALENAANVGAVTVGGDPPGDAISIPPDVDVSLAVDADPAAVVNWLTSCGTMHDDDEHAAFVHVLPADSHAGELVLVVRDAYGGVVWQVWPITAP
jgi:hypothetical protein